jgi:hypothetical protein
MERGGSYRLQEHFADIEGELGRPEAQVANMWPKERDVLRRPSHSDRVTLVPL